MGPHTDVYALGAILYELLTGRPPFKGASLMETLHQVLHQEPVAPRLLNQAVAADLEVVCLKCLDKNAARRYASAAALAEDLRRWQKSEPILARPPGPAGRAVRWCRRHPALAVLACIFVLAAAAVTWQWREAVAAGELAETRRQDADNRRQEAFNATKQAEEEAATAQEVSRFLVGVFEDTDVIGLSTRAFGDQVKLMPTAVDILGRGARKLADAKTLHDKPLVRATLLDKVGNAYAGFGQTKKAYPLLAEALELRRQHLPVDHADLADSLHNLGFLELTRGNARKCTRLCGEAMSIRARRFGSEATVTAASRFFLGFAHAMIDGGKDAGPLLDESARAQRERLKTIEKDQPEQIGSTALALAVTLLMRAHVHSQHSELLKGVPLIAEVQQIARKIPNKDLGILLDHIISGKRWHALGQKDRAARELQNGVRVMTSVVGEHHFLTLMFSKEHAELVFELARYEEAEKLYTRLEREYVEFLGEESLGLSDIYWYLARALERGRLTRAATGLSSEPIAPLLAKVEELARAAVDTDRRAAAEPFQASLHALYYGHVLLRVRKPSDPAAAEEHFRQAWLTRKKLFDPGDPVTLHPLSLLLQSLAAQKKFDEAERLFLDLIHSVKQPKWKGDPSLTLSESARMFAAAGRAETAVLLLEHAAIAGLRDVTFLRTDPAFASLRGREDFRRLVKRLERRK